ncbi:hypothetical protein KUCAC02_031326, partial [Chaenocephalus aceratus]
IWLLAPMATICNLHLSKFMMLGCQDLVLPITTSSRPHSYRPHSYRPHSSKPHSYRPHSSKPHSYRPHSYRPHSEQVQVLGYREWDTAWCSNTPWTPHNVHKMLENSSKPVDKPTSESDSVPDEATPQTSKTAGQGGKNGFTRGSNNMRASALTEHSQCQDHTFAVNAGQQHMAMKSHIDSAKEQSSQKLHSQFKVVFHMTKNDIPDRFPDDTLDLISSLDILLNPSRYPHACKVLICEFSELYPDWATLATIACVLPVSSVPAERSFSLLNRVKTSLRSRLEEERVTRLMRIASCKDTLDTFHFSPAAEDFAAMKARRK